MKLLKKRFLINFPITPFINIVQDNNIKKTDDLNTHPQLRHIFLTMFFFVLLNFTKVVLGDTSDGWVDLNILFIFDPMKAYLAKASTRTLDKDPVLFPSI